MERDDGRRLKLAEAAPPQAVEAVLPEEGTNHRPAMKPPGKFNQRVPLSQRIILANQARAKAKK